MSTRINTNTTAYMAAQNLSNNSDKLSQNIQRLSSGMRINSAADDAAGLVISQNMKAQSIGLQQATSNTNDAINVAKTAEGAMGQVQSLLMSMRQLAVHASNAGVNSAADVAADQTQLASALQSINRIATTTQFSNKKLLDGSASSAATTTSGAASITGTGNSAGLTVVAQGSWSAANTFSTATITGATKSTTISGATGNSGADAFFNGSLTINGQAYTIGSAGNNLNAAGITNAIQASGYTASLDATNGHLVLTSTAAGAGAAAPVVDMTGLSTAALATGAATASSTLTSTDYRGADATMNIGGGSGITSVASSTQNGTSSFTFANGTVVTSTTAVAAVAAETSASTNAATTPNSSANLLTGSNTFKTVAGTSTTGQDLQFQIGSNSGQTASSRISSVATDQLGKNASNYTDANGSSQQVYTDSIKNIDLTTFKGAQDAIAVIDKAISDISSARASVGSFQSNVLQSNVQSLSIASQNVQASMSSIVDTNLSSEIVDYTKNQILVQAGTSALGQANQAPQAILRLLQ
ncbi:flagellin [Capsulimonas corticalis]|uniref:Flagellin n=1 Tax=Capsulimonas corticalis TaxID=2219043 RepID=A0A9N7QDE0_9BACT|nr:flagellin [Capsulimonas corticalis]BDI31135.1 flagellin [Capsulimonas corticalis]